MDIRLHLDADRMTWDDMISLDEWADLSERKRRDLLARFLIDDEGQFLDGEKARNLLGALPLTQIGQVRDALQVAIKEYTGAAVPNPSSGS